jgi:predicted helicase
MPFDMHLVGAASGASGLPLYRFLTDGSRVENITDWALKQFEKAYGKNKAKPITKDAIFHYVYGVLHDPTYREKYAQNLKREFPRLPFYPDFWSWADWGDKLMRLHIGFETVDPWPLARVERSR